MSADFNALQDAWSSFVSRPEFDAEIQAEIANLGNDLTVTFDDGVTAVTVTSDKYLTFVDPYSGVTEKYEPDQRS